MRVVALLLDVLGLTIQGTTPLWSPASGLAGAPHCFGKIRKKGDGGRGWD